MDDLIMEIKARVGEEEYARFRSLCRETATRPLRSHADIGNETAVGAWEIAEFLEHLVAEDRLWQAYLQMYLDAPCYTWLSMIQPHLFGEDEFSQFAVWVQDRLNDEDDALAVPLQFSLLSDWFADERLGPPMWSFLTAAEMSRGAALRLLPLVGPLPYELKCDFLWRQSEDRAAHEAVFEALRSSEFDPQGKLHTEAERNDALKLLSRLTVADEQTRRQLEQSLAQPQHYWLRQQEASI